MSTRRTFIGVRQLGNGSLGTCEALLGHSKVLQVVLQRLDILQWE